MVNIVYYIVATITLSRLEHEQVQLCNLFKVAGTPILLIFQYFVFLHSVELTYKNFLVTYCSQCEDYSSQVIVMSEVLLLR